MALEKGQRGRGKNDGSERAQKSSGGVVRPLVFDFTEGDKTPNKGFFDFDPIPPKFIDFLTREKMIDMSLERDRLAVRLLQKIWSDERRTLLRFMLADLEKEERMFLAEFPRYTKVDRFVLKLLLSGTKYSKIKIQSMVESFFQTKISDGQIMKLRQVSYDYKRERSSKKNRKNI